MRGMSRPRPVPRFGVVLVVVVCLLATVAPAAASNRDTLVLSNGDVVKGEIKLLEYAKLTFSTDAMTTVDIKWDYVVEISSPAYFEVETTDGVRYYGSLAAGKKGSAVLDLAGQITELPLWSIVRIRPIKQRFWDRLDGYVNLGASYTSSSGIGQGTIGTSVTSRRPKFTITSTFDSTITVQPDQPKQTRIVGSLGYTRLLGKRWFTVVNGKLENNSELGIQLRSSAALGGGRYFVQTNRTVAAWSGGVIGNREVPVDGEQKDNLEAFIGASYSFFTYNTPKTNIVIGFVLIPSLSDTGRVRTEFNATVSREIVKDFTVGTTVYHSYDNRPPTEDAKKHDLGVTLSVGWTF
jgi:hypothetical protein